MCYSVQPRDQIFVKGYGFLSFAKNMGKNIGKKYKLKLEWYSQKLLDHAKKSATDTPTTSSKRVIQKIAEAIGDLIGNKIADRTTKVSKALPQNNSETITNKHDQEIPKKGYISLEERQKTIDHLETINIVME